MPAARALLNRTLRHTKNIGLIMAQQSSFKVFFILVFATAFEAGLWLLFRDGFRFLDTLGGAGTMIALRLFSLFFFGMGLMLVLSSIVTSYSTIFRSPEIPFLLSRPFEMRQIVVYKFIESTSLSSWAFFFIIIPFIGSYAWHRELSPFFIVWTLLLSVPFLFLCSGIGAAATLLFVRWFPSGRPMRIVLGVLTGSAVLLAWWYSRGVYAADDEFQFNLGRLVPGLNLASNPLIPSWWVSEGILSLSRGQWVRGAWLAGTVVTSALVMGMAVEWIGGLCFYEGWQRVAAGAQRDSRPAVMLPGMDRALQRILPSDVRAMMMKDIRTFLRDPMQWSQVLIFFGLLALYYSNLRSFHYHLLPDTWRNTVAFLNVFSVAAVMCSLGSRFIYPQLSLEGQGFWIIGLSPTRMNRVLLTKFFLSLVAMVTVSVALMVLSSRMLAAAPLTTLVAVVLSGAISLAVCALSTGLGAVFLNLEQRNPSAIVSGFGGTLNLVLSLGFMLAVIIPFGFVFHLHNVSKITRIQLYQGVAAAGLWMVLLTALATVLPLWIGSRHLRRREF